MRTTRIFWMGSHKVLIPTELEALRAMGYEVFHPPYLGKEKDQSAVYDWTCPPTTLPPEVVQKLSTYNFFWNDISGEVGELLNAYFDCVIVTINGDWLLSFLKAYRGKIIYRTFGEPYSLSAHLRSNGAYRRIVDRDDFWFMPHCIENAVKEEWWLRKRERIVPYCLTDDVLAFGGTWNPKLGAEGSIGLACPNILNPYYNTHFRYLKEHFEERMFRYYGVQVDRFSDPNVVGTLERAEQLKEFQTLAGFLYTYREPNVCYLPPIEMMTIGGPVLYMPGSLLDRYLTTNSAGRVRNEDEARTASKRLAAGDRVLASEIIDSQRGVARRYDSAYTLPILQDAMAELLPLGGEADEGRLRAISAAAGQKPVLLLGHFEGAYSQSDGEYVSVHGIPRVMRRVVQVLTEAGQPVTVTARPEAISETWGFYAAQTSRANLLNVVDFNPVFGLDDAEPAPSDRGSYFDKVRRGDIHWMDGDQSALTILAGGLLKLFGSKRPPDDVAEPQGDYAYAIVPHYYLFPEATTLACQTLVYIPDYMPHFFKGRGWFSDNKAHVATGRELASAATLVMTNSTFTKEYLPESDLEVSAEKIVAFPLPHLAQHSRQSPSAEVVEELSGEEFVFYPTQAHPNKRLDLLVDLWVRLKEAELPDSKLVLTCGVLPEAVRGAVPEDLIQDVVVLSGVSDATLNWLYSNAVCLAFTSEMEGNFPTQVIEALEQDCPIVTFDHPTINAELQSDSAMLLTAPFADLDAFVSQIMRARRGRKQVLTAQKRLLRKIGTRLSYDRYRQNILDLHERMKMAASAISGRDGG